MGFTSYKSFTPALSIRPVTLLLTVLMSVILSGCGEAIFDANAAGALLSTQPVALDGEQVVFLGNEIECGERDGLWITTNRGGGAGVVRLTTDARALGFNSDIQLDGKSQAHAQVKGTFGLRGKKIESFEDQENGTKVLTASAGILIDHMCFPQPLPIMGVRRGEFRADYSPKFLFHQVDGPEGQKVWAFDRLIH